MMKFYTGVGSRHTPIDILKRMTEFAERLEDLDYTLRTGDAYGADDAFSKRVAKKVVYCPEDVKNWAILKVQEYIPSDRHGFDKWKPLTKKLVARDMMQVLGVEGSSLTSFLICWTPTLDYSTSSCGGTGYAVRCAIDYDIPVLNLKDKNVLKLIDRFLGGAIDLDELIEKGKNNATINGDVSGTI